MTGLLSLLRPTNRAREKTPSGGAVFLEVLESRLLLSADLIPGEPHLLLEAASSECAIDVNLSPENHAIEKGDSSIIMTYVVPSDSTTPSTPETLRSASPDGEPTGGQSLGDAASSQSTEPALVRISGTVGAPSQAATVNPEGAAPDLPGLRLVDSDPGNLQGQIIYLDFDGADDVTYHGPITVGPFDIPAFQTPGELAGQEQDLIPQVLTELGRVFAGSGVIFTDSRPSADQPYSTIYVGGDDSAFAQYGSFLGLAEQVDVGNVHGSDMAVVFSTTPFFGAHGQDEETLTQLIAHEAGHLLGYSHAGLRPPCSIQGDLADVAATYSLTITPTNGSVTVSPDKDLYEEGEVVELIPTPETGYCFTGWSGDVRDESLVLTLTMDGNKAITAHFGPWTPPIGIPMPEFGIFETHRMYEGQTYDFGSGPEPYRDAGNGPYTHYIDNTNPNATDTGNPYGTATLPRRTVPEDLAAGSVVEIHGGPYNYGRLSDNYKWMWFSGTGTNERPIFIRGTPGQIPVLTKMEIRVGGSYLVVENLDLEDSTLRLQREYAPHVWEKIALRNLAIHGFISGSGSMITIGDPTYVMHDVVLYNNHIYSNGNVPYGQDTDVIGIMVGTYCQNIWIVDSHIHQNDGDSIQLNAAGGQWAQNNEWPKYVYIGRNILHGDRENAVDLKDCEHVIISQNNVFGYNSHDRVFGVIPTPRPIHSGEPTPLVTADEGSRLAWSLFNDIHDCGRAFRISDEYVNTLNYIIGNRMYNLERDAIITWSNAEVYLINNVIYNVGRGFWGAESGNADAASYVFVNNIFSKMNGYTVDGEVRPDDYISVQRDPPADRAVVLNNVFYQGGGFTWGDSSSDVYNSLAAFVAGKPGKGGGCIEGDPRFADAAHADFHLQATSPGIDAAIESDVYQEFYDLYGLDIRKDLDGRTRYQGLAWDIGAYEYVLSAITNLSVSSTSQNSVTLGWTVPGEQGMTGEPSGYDVRYADSPLTAANWEAATQAVGEPVPGAFGAAQSFTITGLNPGATYYLAIEVKDEAGRFSALSNVVSATTATSGNHAPALTPIGDQSVAENETLTFIVSAVDADPGDTLTYSATGLPTGAGFVPATQTFSWTPAFGQRGTHHATFQVGDGQVTVSQTITITVYDSANHAPVLDAIGDKTVHENEALTFSISATDADGQAITYSASNLPSGASFVTRTFSWTPGSDQAGSHSVTFTASDGQAQDTETITISVANVNRPPVLATIGSRSVNENTSLSFSVSATDPDGDSLTYSATGLPSGAGFANRVFSWIPGYNQAGSYSVTFTVSDGGLTDSEQITISVTNVSDQTPPSVQAVYPAADAIQVPLNPRVTLSISDSGLGVNASTVTIRVNNQQVYSGDNSLQESAYGVCRRMGTRSSYRYYYHPAKLFRFDEQVTVQVTASDAGNNVMTPVSYQFVTEMPSFGRNQPVSATGAGNGHPAIATDHQGDTWAVWHAGQANSRDIYVAKRGSQTQLWDTPVQLTNLASDECNPVIAVGPNDALYVAWQDNRRGNWDIYVSVCPAADTWHDPVRVTDTDDNQTNPAIAIDHAATPVAYLAWQDDGAGNQEIYLASSSTLFASKQSSRITSQAADQTGPALAVGPDNTVYLVWTDQRNGTADVYGSSSSALSWANTQIAVGPGNQQDPAVAVEPGASVLHLLWVNDAGGNPDIFYGTSNGLPGSPLAGRSIVDDSTAAAQSAPVIVAVQDHQDDTHMYACWLDNRVVGNSRDADLYLAEIRSGAGGTNILVGDDGTNSNQSGPALGFDEYGLPVVLWADDRGGTTRIYSACSTYFKPVALASAPITRSAGGRVGTDPAAIDDVRDVSIQIPATAGDCDSVISISEMRNLPGFAAPCIAGFEFGPSGMQFAFPATVTIPYAGSSSGRVITPYWYDAQTGTLSQQGITAIANTTLANGMSAVSFKTTHLTPFYILEGTVPTVGGGGGGGGGGGCALSHSQGGGAVSYFLPYGVLALFVLVLAWKDRRREKESGEPPVS